MRDAVRLVLVDRDALARRAMREEISASGEFVVAAEAADEDDAIELVRRERPDLVLIDIGYPRLEGIPIAKELRRQLPATRMVFCSITDDEESRMREAELRRANRLAEREQIIAHRKREEGPAA